MLHICCNRSVSRPTSDVGPAIALSPFCFVAEVDTFVDLFTEDATRVIQDCPIQQGKAAIRAFQAPLMDQLRPIGIKDNTFDVTYTVDPSQSKAAGMVTTFGKQTFHLGTGDVMVTYHMVLLKRSSEQHGSQWKIHQYISCTIKDQPNVEKIAIMMHK